MKKSIYVLSLLFLLTMTYTSAPAQKFHGVYFHPDGWDVWTCDFNGCLFYSYDDGQTWNLKDCPTLVDLYDVYMVSFTGGTGKGWTVGLNGEIRHTTDGGDHWFRQTYGEPKYLTRIECYADQDTICWVAGGDGYVMKTTNLGDTWVENLTIPHTNAHTDFWGISFVDSLVGWVAGGVIGREKPGGQGYVLKSDGGGDTLSWVVQVQDTAEMDIDTTTQPYDTTWLKYGHDFMDIVFVNALTGWAVGGDDISNEPFALKTEDGGLSWDTMDVSAGYGILRGVDFTNENEGWAVGEFGVILHTSNGGDSWQSQTSGTQAHLFDVDFISSTKGIIPGDSCLILYTSDGGQNWLPAEVRFYFIRGDVNSDSLLTMSDAIYGLQYLYVPGSPEPPCMKAADVNDNAAITMADTIYLLKYLYVPGAPKPPDPCPGCGWDPTPDRLCCGTHPCMQ